MMMVRVRDAGASEGHFVMKWIEVAILVDVRQQVSRLLHSKEGRLPMQVLYYEKAAVTTKWGKQKVWLDSSTFRLSKSSAPHAEQDKSNVELTRLRESRCRSNCEYCKIGLLTRSGALTINV